MGRGTTDAPRDSRTTVERKQAEYLSPGEYASRRDVRYEDHQAFVFRCERGVVSGTPRARDNLLATVQHVGRLANMNEDQIAEIVLDVAFELHRSLGPGLLESAYQALMIHGLRKRGLRVEAEVLIPLHWDGVEVDAGFRADIVVEDLVILELKSVERLMDVHKKQLLTYLKVSGKRLGLLINFGQAFLKDGICRIANGMPT